MPLQNSLLTRARALALAAIAACALVLVSCDQSEQATADKSSVIGKQIQFNQGAGSETYRPIGWSHPEEKFTWAEGTSAKVALPIGDAKGPLTFRVMMSALIHPPDLPFQPVEVLASGKSVAQWQVSAPNEFSAIIPADAVKEGGLLEIEFRMPKAASPKALGLSEDARVLGVCVHWIQLTKL